MMRPFLVAVALAWVIVPVWADTEQDTTEQLGDDLAEAVVPLHRIVPAHQLSLTASLDLAGDRAQLSMHLALKALQVDLAVASANLSHADAQAAPAARHQYLTDILQAVAKYQTSVAEAYSGWTTLAAEAYQASQQSGAQGMQTAFQGLAVAQQRVAQSLTAAQWGDVPPEIAPTLLDLSALVNEDAERLAQAGAAVAQARAGYLTDVNDTLAACDREVETALTLEDPYAMADALTDALADAHQTTCRRYQQYDTDVRSVLTTLNEPCQPLP